MRNAVLAFEFYRDVKAARKAVRKGWHSAEAFISEAAACVKNEPLKSISFVAGVAFGVGAATVWLVSRK
jgi:hypothetical protein